MITIRKLRSLKPATAQRKCAYVFHQMALDLQTGRAIDRVYMQQVLDLASRLDSNGDRAYYREKGQQLRTADTLILTIALEDLYYHVLGVLGTTVADWDIQDRGTGKFAAGARTILPIRPYLDRIRSPFNVGAIFRTAEAFCCDRVLVAPETASPDHNRAIRTARGCLEVLPWQWMHPDALGDYSPLFALESGGMPVDEFDFPAGGTVIVGSEEMGVSPELLATADGSLGRVTIPTYGVKGSLNVSVAFGILMQWWVYRLHGAADRQDA